MTTSIEIDSMNGYDLDGTLSVNINSPKREKPYFKQTGKERQMFEEEKLHHYVNAKRTSLIPIKPFVVISGRSIRYLQPTIRWLEKKGLEPEAVLLMDMSRTRENMIAHKIDMCRKLKVVHYYEDDPKIAKAMSKAGITVTLGDWGKYEG